MGFQTTNAFGKIDTIKVDRKDYHTNLVLSVGSSFATSSKSFFDDYQKYLGGYPKTFNFSPIASIQIKFDLDTGYKISLAVDYFHTGFVDSYNNYVKSNQGFLLRNVGEKLEMDNFPVIAGIDVIPVDMPYKTYVGFGAGILVSKIFWKEDVSSPKENDTRLSGVKYDQTVLSPAIRLTTGLELNFDKKSERDFLKSLVAEARFSYLFRYVSIFEGIKDEDAGFKEIAEKSYAILPFYLGLYLGLSFNIGYL